MTRGDDARPEARGETLRLRDGRGLRTFARGPRPAPGGDLVILEAGLAGGAGMWSLVMAGLEDAGVSTLAYDRAGYGGSDPAAGPRDVRALAADLDGLLDLVEQRWQPARIVLVAHSWGGLIVRIVAAQRSDPAVAGLLLVDPSDEKEDWALTRPARLLDRAHAALHPLLAATGLLRVGTRLALRRLPGRARAVAVEEIATVPSARAIAAELRAVDASLRAMRADAPDVGRVPLVVVTATRAPWFARGVRAEMLAAHRRTVGDAADGRHVLAEESGHQVMLSRPELVVRETLALLGTGPRHARGGVARSRN